jgi:hypothetical protein
MWKSLARGAASSAALLFVVSGCGQSAPPPPKAKGPSPASQAWLKVASAFIEDYMQAQPAFAAQAGRHEFDGQLPDVSAHGLKREIARLHDQRDQIAAVDAAGLEPRERFDRDYLLAVVDKDLFWIEKTQFPFSNPSWYLGQIDPDVYLSRNYAPLDKRMKAYIKYAQAIPKIAASIKENLKSPLPKTYVELGIEEFGGLADFYTKNVAPVFASVSDADLQKQLKDADAVAAQAMTGLKDYLVGARKSATDKYAFGPELFAQMLKQTEQVDLPVDQIEAAGRADLDHNTAALKAECSAYDAKASLAQCVAKMQANKPKGGPVEEARIQLKMLKEFIVQKNVVSIPSNDEALVAEAPPTSILQVRTTRAWRPCLTSRRPIQSGARPSRLPIFPVTPRCYLPRFTRSGRDTSCSSCIRTRIPTSSKGCGWGMPSPKAGRITAKKCWSTWVSPKAIRRSTSVSSTRRCCAMCACCRPSDCIRMA